MAKKEDKKEVKGNPKILWQLFIANIVLCFIALVASVDLLVFFSQTGARNYLIQFSACTFAAIILHGNSEILLKRLEKLVKGKKGNGR